MTTKENISANEEMAERITWLKPEEGFADAVEKLKRNAGEFKEAVRAGIQKRLEADENVNHPSHYCDGKIEVIDFIEDKKLGYHLGNVIKYVSRAGKKCPDKKIEDLKKASWYLNRYIDKLEATNEKEV